MHEDLEMCVKEDGCVRACMREWWESGQEGGG